MHCRVSNCLPKDKGGDKECQYYVIEGNNRVDIEKLEKKRIWEGKKPRHYTVEKKIFWWLWSERCYCADSCPRWKVYKSGD